MNSDSRIVQSFYDFNHALIEQLTGTIEASAEPEMMKAIIRPHVEIEYLQALSATKMNAEAVLIQGISTSKPILKVALA